MPRKIEFTYKNSFRKKFIDSKEGVADPFLIKVNGFYYLFYTAKEGIKAFKSFDLLHFTKVNGDGNVHNKNLNIRSAFAPEVFYFNGYFYLVASPSGNGHYIFRSDSIEGPFNLITSNFHEMIDGSFFVDSDDKIYFSRAAETGIILKELDNNEIIKDNYPNFIDEKIIKEAKIGRWNEGPHIFKRYGKYYLTYTGTHFLSNAYRVEYVSGNNLNKLTYKDVLLLSTRDDYYGLGHSMNILGPNLDSYFVVYHDMNKNGIRTFNIARELFDGDLIKINNPYKDDNFNIERPDFETFLNDKNYLSNFKTSSTFSLEFNIKGSEARCIFGYENEEHYFELYLSKNLLILDEILKNEVKRHVIHTFNYGVLSEVLHTLRVQYDKGKIAIYFDNSELVFNYKIKINNGRFGVKNNELNDAYLAYSKYAFGSSDLNETYVDSSFIYKKSEYQFFIKNSEKYYLTFSLKKGKTFARFIFNNKEYEFRKELKNEENIILDELDLKRGFYELRFLSNIKGIKEIEIMPSRHKEKNEISLNSSLKEIDKFNVYHRFEIKDNYIYFENDRNIILSKDTFKDFTFKANVKVTGNPVEDTDFVGLGALIKNYAKDNQFENAYSLNGILFVLNIKNIFIIEAKFNHSRILYKKENKFKDKEISLKISKNPADLRFFIDNEEIFKLKNTNKYIEGEVGILNNHASGLFTNIEILEDNI